MKCTTYFRHMRLRPDRAAILDEWILLTSRHPDREEVQSDGRLRRWRRIPAAGGRVLRVVLLADGETIHNAFFDRNAHP
jgi:hypothetical protein